MSPKLWLFLTFQTEIGNICWQQQVLTAQKKENICKNLQRITVSQKKKKSYLLLKTYEVTFPSGTWQKEGEITKFIWDPVGHCCFIAVSEGDLAQSWMRSRAWVCWDSPGDAPASFDQAWAQMESEQRDDAAIGALCLPPRRAGRGRPWLWCCPGWCSFWGVYSCKWDVGVPCHFSSHELVFSLLVSECAWLQMALGKAVQSGNSEHINLAPAVNYLLEKPCCLLSL